MTSLREQARRICNSFLPGNWGLFLPREMSEELWLEVGREALGRAREPFGQIFCHVLDLVLRDMPITLPPAEWQTKFDANQEKLCSTLGTTPEELAALKHKGIVGFHHVLACEGRFLLIELAVEDKLITFEEIGVKSFVLILGSEPEVEELGVNLMKEGIAVGEDPNKDYHPRLAIVCLQPGRELPGCLYDLIQKGFRILPCLFPGSVTPAIFADIRPADFRAGWENGFRPLVKAIRVFSER